MIYPLERAPAGRTKEAAGLYKKDRHTDLIKHDFNNFLIRLPHAVSSEPSDILNCRLYTIVYNAFAVFKFLMIHIHMVSQNAGFNTGSNLSGTGRFCAVTDNT